MLVVPASMTLAATSSNEVASLGYIVVIDSERLTSSMLLMLEESTVTWISTGLPSNRIGAEWMEGGVFVLWHFFDFAIEFGG